MARITRRHVGQTMTTLSQHHEHRQHETTPTNGPVHAYPGPGPPGRSRQVARPHAERLRCSWRRCGRSGPRSVLAWRPHTPASPKSVSSPQAASRAVPAARRRATRRSAPGGGCGRPCTQGRRGECQGEGIGASEKQKKSMGGQQKEHHQQGTRPHLIMGIGMGIQDKRKNQ